MTRRGTLTTALLIVIGVGVSVAGTVFLRGHVIEKAEANFRANVDAAARSLKRETEANLDVLRSLRALYDAAGEVDCRQFGIFAGQALERHPGLQALEWIPLVRAEERERYEETVRREGFPAFRITELSGAGRLQPAGAHDEYFPVYCVEPIEGNEAALGFDVASDATRRVALEASRAGGVIQATAPITLVQEPEGRRGFLVFLPVFGAGEKAAAIDRATVRGFVVGVYRAGDIFESAPGVARAMSTNIEMHLVDDSPDGGEGEFARVGGTPDAGSIGPEHHSGLEVAGRRWEIVARPGDPYGTARRAWEPWAILACGLLLTGALVAYVRVTTTRRKSVERLVDAGTHDLREVNERLEEQRNLLQSILDNLGDGVAVTDEAGRLTILNPAANEILGVGLLDVGPDQWSEQFGLYYPDTKTPCATEDLPLARAVAGEESGDVELFVRNPKRPGGVFIRVTATPLRDRHDRLRGGVAVFRDINERKWAETVLRDSVTRFRTIVEATASALIILSSERRIREFNPQAERLFGLGRAEALGQDFLELCLPEEYREPVAADLERALAGEQTPGFAIPVSTRDGAERTVLWSFSRLAETEEQDAVVIATGHDITERRQAEQARRVRELAAHLQSAREDERAHVAREIHDELGQALTGLKLEVSYLSRKVGQQDPVMRERFDGIGRLIDLTIGSVRRIAADLRPQILDELGLVDAIRWQVTEFEKRTKIPCTLDLTEKSLEWPADRATAMFRILQEALTNVARHAGATQVHVRLTQRSERILLEIRDDGRGITEEQTGAPASFGLLGMEERARMFGGTLQVESGEQRGTIVTVGIPY